MEINEQLDLSKKVNFYVNLLFDNVDQFIQIGSNKTTACKNRLLLDRLVKRIENEFTGVMVIANTMDAGNLLMKIKYEKDKI